MYDINIWSLVVASIVSFVIGAIWYSPILFGTEWMAHLHMTAADVAAAQAKGMTGRYVMQLILTFVTFIVLSFAIASLGAYSIRDGAMVGFLAWLGFFVPVSFGGMLWENKSLKITLITSVCTLLTWIIGGGIIGGWN